MEQEELIAYLLPGPSTPSIIIQKINNIAHTLMSQIMYGDGDLFIDIYPTGSSQNSQVDPILGFLVQYDIGKMKRISFKNNPKGLAVFLRVLAILKVGLKKGYMSTKRSIFYQDVILFETQKTVDQTINDIARCLEIPRAQMGVVSCPKGFISGKMKWTNENGSITECWGQIITIPSQPEKLKKICCSAKFIMVIEKESVFARLTSTKLIESVLMITGRGMPDFSTRYFVKMLQDIFNIPILGLFDCDPYGLLIMQIYKYGSRIASYDASSMAICNLKWLGIRPSDMMRIPSSCLMDLTEKDQTILMGIRKQYYTESAWINECDLMLSYNKKAEIESLLSIENNDLIDLYIPQKLNAYDWI